MRFSAASRWFGAPAATLLLALTTAACTSDPPASAIKEPRPSTPAPVITTGPHEVWALAPTDCGPWPDPAHGRGMLTRTDVWPGYDGRRSSAQLLGFGFGCWNPRAVPDSGPLAPQCSAGFPWSSIRERGRLLAGRGVREQYLVRLSGPSGSRVTETVLVFPAVDAPGVTTVRALAGQCGTVTHRAGIDWVDTSAGTTGTLVTGQFLISVTFRDTHLGSRRREAVIRRAAVLTRKLYGHR